MTVTTEFPKKVTDLDGLEYLSLCQDLMDLHEFMADNDLSDAMDLVIKCMTKPDVPSVQIASLIIKFQAWSAKFGLLATTYTTIKKGKSDSIEAKKKNVYYTASDVCDKMASALKYMVRERSIY